MNAMMNETAAIVILAVGFVGYLALLIRDIRNYNKIMKEWKKDNE
jgi:preprotein translocase subunit Sss1